MKRPIFVLFLLCLFCGLAPAAQKYELEEPKDTVADYAQVVEPAAAAKVVTLSADLKRITSINFKVLIIRQLPPGVDAETYGRQIYERWDLGRTDKGEERGVLLFISVIDRQAKIIVGSRVKYLMPADVEEQIENDVNTDLARGKFSEGMGAGAAAISGRLLSEWNESRLLVGSAGGWQTISLTVFALFLASVILPFLLRGSFLMGAAIFAGGLLGYIFLGYIGLVLCAALGFFLGYGRRI
ncbi:MAG: TPM domain-containing protein [Candidatus Margulisbacteria bacterium]|nr:TPM domain-containing protein [Candidatus Margulisiibacteriota bacterium]